MKKYKLIKEAYDRFRPGSKVSFDGFMPFIVSGQYEVGKQTNNHIVDSVSQQTVYRDNVWAEIVDPGPELFTFEVKDGVINYTKIDDPEEGKVVIPQAEPEDDISAILILVDNEKEYRFLMAFYEQKGYQWATKKAPNSLPYNSACRNIEFKPKFSAMTDGTAKEQERMVMLYDTFAGENNLPRWILSTEDGIPMYGGDNYYEASQYFNKKKWSVHDIPYRLHRGCRVVTNRDTSKAFNTKEAAEAWVNEQNKIKETETILTANQTAIIKERSIVILDRDRRVLCSLSPSDIEDISHYYKELTDEN